MKIGFLFFLIFCAVSVFASKKKKYADPTVNVRW